MRTSLRGPLQRSADSAWPRCSSSSYWLLAVRLFLGRRDGTVSFEQVTDTLAAYYEAFERILGIPPTSWPLLDDDALRFRFG